MKKILIAILAVICLASFCYAIEPIKDKKATEPVGAVVETAGVFVGQISAAVEQSLGGGKGHGYVTVVDETGKTKMFPIDPTVQILDNTAHALTLNQLKKGEKVSVEYSKGKTSSVKVVK